MATSGSGRLVFVSGGGTHYHHDQKCRYLAKGQRGVELRGGAVAVVRKVQLRAVLDTHDACRWCVIRGHTALDDVPELEPGDVRVRGNGAALLQRIDAIAGTDAKARRAAERARDRPRIARLVGTSESVMWIRLGFTESMVAAFAERRWGLSRAVELRQRGFAPVQIQRWLREGAEGDHPPSS